MRIEVLDTYIPEYDAFVRSFEDAKLCHLQRWGSMIRQTCSHKILYIVAYEHKRICGAMPLTLINSVTFGKQIISQAFSNYGGPLADNPKILLELLNRAFKLALEHRCHIVEFRSSQLLPCNLFLRSDKVCMFLPLVSNSNEMWRRFRPEIRNRVRKAKKSGLSTTNGGQELLREFYDIWTIRMRQLGTPCYSKNLFMNILKAFPENTRIFLVKLGELVIGAAFSYSFNGLTQCRWAATRIEFNKLAPNTILYWAVIEYNCLIGNQLLDLGRSTVNSSQYEFKRRWGSWQVPLYYQYWVQPGKKFSFVNPENPKYISLVKIWKKTPLGITRLIGPYISCNLA